MGRLKSAFLKFKENLRDEHYKVRLVQDAVEKMPNWDSMGNDPKVIEMRWHRILQKIKNNRPLNRVDVTRAFHNFSKIPTDLQGTFHKLVAPFVNDDFFKSILISANENFQEIELIKFLCSGIETEQAFKKISFKFVSQNIEVIKNGPEDVYVNLIFERKTKLSNIEDEVLKFNKKSSSYERLLKQVVHKDKTCQFFETDFMRICMQLVKLKDDLRYLQLLDDYLGDFLDLDDNSWEGKVIDSEFIATKALFYLLNSVKIERSQLLNNFKRVLKQRNQLMDAIDQLNKFSDERGEFWRDYMPFSDSVIVTKGDSSIAVAFYFGEYVVVEFAPTGNATYIYKKGIFESKIKNYGNSNRLMYPKDWKKSHFAETVEGFTRDDGKLWHTKGWQYNYKRFLEFLLRKRDAKKSV